MNLLKKARQLADKFKIPQRGFNEDEFIERLLKAQILMEQYGLGCILLTSESEVYYFTGFMTEFWQSPTRPWYVILPSRGKPIAVIPSIGEKLMSSCFVSEIITWMSPDGEDDGLSLLIKTIKGNINSIEKIGVMSGRETYLRMPLKDILTISNTFGESRIFDITDGIQYLRMIKSEREIEKIRYICKKVSNVFTNFSEFLKAGIPLSEIFRQFKINCLNEGMDDVSYLVGAAGEGGYFDIIAPPSSQPISNGDILMLDTGTKWDGYFCDFNRNFAIGNVESEAERTHKILYDSISLAAEMIKPSKTSMRDIFHTLNSFLKLENKSEDKASISVGRFGHGLGIQLTERPSIIEWDDTTVEPGMVLTLEPSLVYGEKKHLMVAEENILITNTGVEFLSSRWPRDLPNV